MQTSNLFWLRLFWKNQDNNLQSAGGQYGIWPTDSTAGMFDVAKRCIANLTSINLLTGLTWESKKSAILDSCLLPYGKPTPKIQHRKEINPKPIISFFKTKQQEFIHPLILSPTHANKIDENPKKSSLFSILFFLALQKKRIVELTILSIKKA
jgi:hypothetical protein